ncbi:hypothetical protein BJF90_03815 [Pseudonocardia sp. CNS-004]|nr:hypothetical protein BJF90_03815 [Pseudonocardia sp. CNS-004]
MCGEPKAVILAGTSMTRLVSAIPVVAEHTGRAVVLVGGLAVMCRLDAPYRATTDLDTVDRRVDGEPPQLELLLSAGAARSGPSGALVSTPFGAVQVDVLQVTDGGRPGTSQRTRLIAFTVLSHGLGGVHGHRWCSLRTSCRR